MILSIQAGIRGSREAPIPREPGMMHVNVSHLLIDHHVQLQKAGRSINNKRSEFMTIAVQ
jgi:hypothetical protein